MPGIKKTFFIHGINLKPQKLSGLMNAVSPENSVLVSLYGHSPGESTKNITSDVWKRQLKDIIHKQADGDASLSLVGYSLGGILASYLVLTDRSLPVKKLCLIAPAILPHFSTLYGGLARALTHFLHIPVPSLMNAEYSANRWVYPEFYSSLFELVTQFKDLAPNLREDLEVKAFFHPRDCLVNSKKSDEELKRHFKNYESNFSLLAPSRPVMNHLLIDEKSLGEKIFVDLAKDIKSFLM